MTDYLGRALAYHGLSLSDLAEFQVFLDANCGIPEDLNFSDFEHLEKLAAALDRLQKLAPVLLLALEEQAYVDALEESAASVADADRRVEEADEEREKMFEENEKTLEENARLQRELSALRLLRGNL